jgi:FtsH-binding integral membrane protein
MAFIPKKYEHIAFGLLLSGLMSAVVSMIASLRAVGFDRSVLTLWIGSWPIAWSIAFPTILVVAPMVRRLLKRIVRPE